jgi:hypothetical protein
MTLSQAEGPKRVWLLPRELITVRPWVLSQGKKMTAEFKRKELDEDSVKHESLCMSCSHKVFAYTTADLAEKERQHKCQKQERVESRSVRDGI